MKTECCNSECIRILAAAPDPGIANLKSRPLRYPQVGRPPGIGYIQGLRFAPMPPRPRLSGTRGEEERKLLTLGGEEPAPLRS